MEQLLTQPNKNVKPGVDNIAVRSALRLIQKASLIHARKENERREIQRLFEDGFEITNPSGNRKISSKLLQQILWKVVGKMKPLDFSLQGTGVPENVEKLATDGLMTVLDEGKFANCLRDKNGVFFKTALFGDAFMQVGVDEENDYPIRFQMVSGSDVYVDPWCVDLRDATGGLSCNEMVMIYRYSWDRFEELYPEGAKTCGIGPIPRSIAQFKQLEKEWTQELYARQEYIEVAHYYNVTKKRYTIFAGPACTVISDLSKKEYPFIKDNKPYLPVLHFKFFPSSEGFYNHGIGHAVFDLATVAARMDNMAYNHAEDNIWPVVLYNTPKGQSSSIFQRILLAQQQRATGGKGIVAMEYDATGTTKVTAENLMTPPITQEWERAFTRLEQQIKRLGFQLDDVDRGRTVTATQIISEEESADAAIKQVGEMNASEYKFAYELALEFVKKFIDESNDTPLNLSTNITLELNDPQTGKPIQKQVRAQGFTLGMLAEELNKNHYWIKMNVRSGAIPSNVMQQTQVTRALQAVAPGSPAWNKLVGKFMQLNDQDVSMEDLAPQQAPQGTGQVPGQPGPSDTEQMMTQMGGNQVPSDQLI